MTKMTDLPTPETGHYTDSMLAPAATVVEVPADARVLVDWGGNTFEAATIEAYACFREKGTIRWVRMPDVCHVVAFSFQRLVARALTLTPWLTQAQADALPHLL